jgi:hypothetical protein
VLVMTFVVFFSAVLGIAWRRVASALRVEHACELRGRCDAGSIQVLAQAMQVLETRLHCVGSGTSWDVSTTSSPDCQPVSLTTKYQFKSRSTYFLPGDTAPHWYKITFTPTTSDGSTWKVDVFVAQPNEDFNSSSLAPLPSNPP